MSVPSVKTVLREKKLMSNNSNNRDFVAMAFEIDRFSTASCAWASRQGKLSVSVANRDFVAMAF
jgi:hypothetical protein